MSQKKEKYARRMERRVNGMESQMDKLTQRVNEIGTAVVGQRRQIIDLQDNLAVYRAAMAQRDMKEARRQVREQRQRRREAEERRMKNRMASAMLLILAAVLLVLIVYCVSTAQEEKQAATASPTATAAIQSDPVAILDFTPTAMIPDEAEDPMESEKIEEALLARGYFSLAVPMPFEYQDYMRIYCAAYNCPYSLALAVAEVESDFDVDAVGAAGEVGIMQLSPGPDGSYHAELEAATGLNPTTPPGNIAGGCYLLGKYLEEYGDTEKALMAYNLGVAGAREAWAAGITSTDYSTAVIRAMEGWECIVSEWDGQ